MTIPTRLFFLLTILVLSENDLKLKNNLKSENNHQNKGHNVQGMC